VFLGPVLPKESLQGGKEQMSKHSEIDINLLYSPSCFILVDIIEEEADIYLAFHEGL
jgi:hypothetical protein